MGRDFELKVRRIDKLPTMAILFVLIAANWLASATGDDDEDDDNDDDDDDDGGVGGERPYIYYTDIPFL